MTEGILTDKYAFEPLMLLEDEPVHSHKVDELTLLPFAKAIAGTAMGTKGPFTIGTFADWGQGKTSVLKQAKSLIESKKEDHIVTVWFNAWQFENEAHPIIPMIATIAAEVEKKTPSATGKMWKQFHAALGGLAYGFSAAGFSGKNMIDKEKELLKSQEDHLKSQSLYYQSFDALSKFTLSNNDIPPKIIVFIDDLDRCLPPNALKLLESIKLVLAQQGFIFVLAVDRKVLESFLSKRYKEDFGIDDYEGGVSYLDKIVQLPIALPTHKCRFETYISALLQRKLFDSNLEVKEALIKIKGLLATGSNHNPRSLVRIINNLIIDRYLMREQGIGVNEQTISMCAVSRFLQQYLGPIVYYKLVNSQWICDQVHKSIFENKPPTPRSFIPHDPGKSTEEIILEKINLSIFLVDFFKTTAVSNWLMEESMRNIVNDFLQTRREDSVESSMDEKLLIELEVKKTIRKGDNQKLYEEDIQEVTELNLSELAISNHGLSYVCPYSNLKTLIISSPAIDDGGLPYISKLSKLESLSLSDTKISDIGLVYIAELTNINKLYLQNTSISDEGLSFLSGLTKLEILNLEHTHVTGEGFSHLQSCQSLKYIYLTGLQLVNGSLLFLQELQSLTDLGLRNTNISDSDIPAIINMRKLRSLVVEGSKLSNKGLEKISKALPECGIHADGKYIKGSKL